MRISDGIMASVSCELLSAHDWDTSFFIDTFFASLSLMVALNRYA